MRFRFGFSTTLTRLFGPKNGSEVIKKIMHVKACAHLELITIDALNKQEYERISYFLPPDSRHLNISYDIYQEVKKLISS